MKQLHCIFQQISQRKWIMQIYTTKEGGEIDLCVSWQPIKKHRIQAVIDNQLVPKNHTFEMKEIRS